MDKPLSEYLSLSNPQNLAAYQKSGGYEGFNNALKMQPKEVQQQVSDRRCDQRPLGRTSAQLWHPCNP